VSLSDKLHRFALLICGRSTVDSVWSNFTSMMEEVSEIRSRLKEQRDSVDEGMRIGMCSR
jgi:hypothetical protein